MDIQWREPILIESLSRLSAYTHCPENIGISGSSIMTNDRGQKLEPVPASPGRGLQSSAEIVLRGDQNVDPKVLDKKSDVSNLCLKLIFKLTINL